MIRITWRRLDNIFCFASNCILEVCDTMCVSNTGVVMYEAKKLFNHSWFFNGLALKFSIVRGVTWLSDNLLYSANMELCLRSTVKNWIQMKVIWNVHLILYVKRWKSDVTVEIVARVFALLKAVLVGETLRLMEKWEHFQLIVLNRWFIEHRMGWAAQCQRFWFMTVAKIV